MITAAGSMSRCGHGTNSGFFKLVVVVVKTFRKRLVGTSKTVQQNSSS
jgi:hypothetical protein